MQVGFAAAFLTLVVSLAIVPVMFRLDPFRHQQIQRQRWVAGHRGGMLAGLILSGTTRFAADLLIVDDPVKGAAEADSAAHRRRLLAEFKASLLSRLHPGRSCVILTTRGTSTSWPGNCRRARQPLAAI
jgi:hypothetical protein